MCVCVCVCVCVSVSVCVCVCVCVCEAYYLTLFSPTAENVLVLEGGRRVKLTDFGTAVHIEEIAKCVSKLTGLTPHFTAPEVHTHTHTHTHTHLTHSLTLSLSHTRTGTLCMHV